MREPRTFFYKGRTSFMSRTATTMGDGFVLPGEIVVCFYLLTKRLHWSIGQCLGDFLLFFCSPFLVIVIDKDRDLCLTPFKIISRILWNHYLQNTGVSVTARHARYRIFFLNARNCLCVGQKQLGHFPFCGIVICFYLLLRCLHRWLLINVCVTFCLS